MANWSSPASNNVKTATLWCTTYSSADESPDVSPWASLSILSVVQHTQGGRRSNVYAVRLHTIIAKSTGGAAVELVSEVEITLPSETLPNEIDSQKPPVPAVPIAFAYQNERKVLTILSSSRVARVYQLTFSEEVSGVNEITSISVKFLDMVVPANMSSLRARGPATISLCALDENYLAIVGFRRRKTKVEEVLTVWDTKYGALHCEKVLSEVAEEISMAARMFHAVVTKSPLSGPVLTVSASRLSSLTSTSFTSTVTFTPFYCAPLTLAAVLGKMRKPILEEGGNVIGSVSENGVIKPVGLGMATTGPIPPPEDGSKNDEWSEQLAHLDALDRDYVMKLLNPSVTGKDFNVIFCEWIQKKLLELKNIGIEIKSRSKPKKEERAHKRGAAKNATGKKVNGIMGTEHEQNKQEGEQETLADEPKEKLPHYLANPPHRSLIVWLPTIELSTSVTFLLLRRCFSNPKIFWPRHSIQYLLRLGYVSTRSVPGGIVGAALEREDLFIIEAAIKHVPDLGESEMVEVLRYICGAEEGRWKPSSRSAREKKLAAFLRLKDQNKKWRQKSGKSHPDDKEKMDVDAEQDEDEGDAAELAEKLENAAETPAVDGEQQNGDAVETRCTPAQAHFLRLLFGRRRTDNFLTQAMQKRMGVKELAVVLGWISGILCAEQEEESGWESMNIDDVSKSENESRPPLWWLWTPERPSEKGVDTKAGSVEEWSMVRLIVIDAMFSTILSHLNIGTIGCRRLSPPL